MRNSETLHYAFFVCTILIALLLFSCGDNLAYSAYKHKYKQEKGLETEKIIFGSYRLKGYNPFFSDNEDEKTLSLFVHGSLFQYLHKSRKFYPFFARSITIDTNETTVALIENIKGQDNGNIDAEYVAYYFSQIIPVLSNEGLSESTGMDKYKFSSDGYALKIGYDRIDEGLYKILTLPILAKSTLEKILKNPDTLYEYGKEKTGYSIVSTGLWSQDATSPFLLRVNNGISEALGVVPYTKSIEIVKYLNQADFLNAIGGGLIDIGFIEQDVSAYTGFSEYTVYAQHDPSGLYAIFLNFNNSDGVKQSLFKNIQFRKWLLNSIYRSGNGQLKYFSAIADERITATITGNFISALKKNPIQLSIISENKKFSLEQDLLISILQKSKIPMNFSIESINTLLAKIYATRSWDAALLQLDISYPLFIDIDFFKINSWGHIINLPPDNTLFTDEEVLVSNVLDRFYSPKFFDNPEKTYNHVDALLKKTILYIPVYIPYRCIIIKKTIRNIDPEYGNSFWFIGRMNNAFLFKKNQK